MTASQLKVYSSITDEQAESLITAVRVLIDLDISTRSGDWNDFNIDNIIMCVSSLVENFWFTNDLLTKDFYQNGLLEIAKKKKEEIIRKNAIVQSRYGKEN